MTIRESRVSISWSTSSETIDGEEFAVQGVEHVLQFDCVTAETHESTATLTEHAVERGAAIADHKQANAERVTIEATVTNTPIGLPPSSGADTFPVFQETRKSAAANASVRVYTGSFDRILDVHEVLRSLVNLPTPVTITTRTTTYENVQINGVTAPRKSEDGDSISFAISGVAIRIADSQRVDVPTPAEPRGRPPLDTGTQGTTEDRRSVLLRAADGSGFSDVVSAFAP